MLACVKVYLCACPSQSVDLCACVCKSVHLNLCFPVLCEKSVYLNLCLRVRVCILIYACLCTSVYLCACACILICDCLCYGAHFEGVCLCRPVLQPCVFVLACDISSMFVNVGLCYGGYTVACMNKSETERSSERSCIIEK